jgi:hypothetical protein
VKNNFRLAATNLEIQCSALQWRDALLFAALGLSLALFSRGLRLATSYLTRHVRTSFFMTNAIVPAAKTLYRRHNHAAVLATAYINPLHPLSAAN